MCVLFLGITRLKRTSLSNLTWNHQHIPDLVLPILFALPFLSFFLQSIEAIYTWIIWAKQHFKACWKDMWAALKPVGNSLCFNGWSMEISRLWEAGCLHFHKKVHMNLIDSQPPSGRIQHSPTGGLENCPASVSPEYSQTHVIGFPVRRVFLFAFQRETIQMDPISTYCIHILGDDST